MAIWHNYPMLPSISSSTNLLSSPAYSKGSFLMIEEKNPLTIIVVALSFVSQRAMRQKSSDSSIFPALASWATIAVSLFDFIKGMVFDIEISSKSNASHWVLFIAYSAPVAMVTSPRQVLIPHFFDMDFATMLDEVCFPIWITLDPVS